MTPLTQKPIIFINKANCIVDLDLLEKACVWYSQKPMFSTKIISLHSKYPCVSIYKEKVHVHRLLLGFLRNKKLLTEEYVHHKNGNKLDCSIDNLQIISPQEHQSMHNKGKTISEWHKERIRNWNRIHKLKHGKYVIHETKEL